MGKPVMQNKREEYVLPDDVIYEKIIQLVCGENWRDCGKEEIDGAMGVAIVRALMDGVENNVEEIAYHLDIPKFMLSRAYSNLDSGGIFQRHMEKDRKFRDRIESDWKSLKNRDVHVWCWYAASASGYVK